MGERARLFIFLCVQNRIWIIFWASCYSAWLTINRSTGGVNLAQPQSLTALIVLLICTTANISLIGYLNYKHLHAFRHSFYKYYLVTTDRLYILHVRVIFGFMIIAGVLGLMASFDIKNTIDIALLWINIASIFQFLSSQYTQYTPDVAYRKTQPNDVDNNIYLNFAKAHIGFISNTPITAINCLHPTAPATEDPVPAPSTEPIPKVFLF
eukprot:c1869_g1_i1.p1 GENE.c1869_g1_i1~~c1869_g1_i1.p1  ORF type:complete len:218 (+),score=31.91 c1869_g1_i1:26-655(+)